MTHRRHTKHTQAGFTLVELMVSLTLFTIVVLAAVSSLYTVNNAARKVEAMRSVLDNLNFATESMSRTIRTGSDIVCNGTANTSGTHNCPFTDPNSGSTQLSLLSTLGATQHVQYRFALNPATGTTGEIEKQVQDENGQWSNWVAITAPEIDVQKFSFFVSGADATDGMQPSVIIMVQGVATAGENTAPFAIQTYVSSRAAE